MLIQKQYKIYLPVNLQTNGWWNIKMAGIYRPITTISSSISTRLKRYRCVCRHAHAIPCLLQPSMENKSFLHDLPVSAISNSFLSIQPQKYVILSMASSFLTLQHTFDSEVNCWPYMYIYIIYIYIYVFIKSCHRPRWVIRPWSLCRGDGGGVVASGGLTTLYILCLTNRHKYIHCN